MVRKDVGGAGAPLAPTLDPPLVVEAVVDGGKPEKDGGGRGSSGRGDFAGPGAG